MNNKLEVLIDGVRYVPALEPVEPVEPPEKVFNAAAFFDHVRKNLFYGTLNQDQVNGLNLIGSTCLAASFDRTIEQSAYVLATVLHETASTMQPIAEYGGPSTRYAPWYGRGHVQLTWEENYKKQQEKLKNHPARPENVPYQVHDDRELALNPATSALICVLGMRDGDFTGRNLNDYINSSNIDYVNARKIVNGMDKADMIAGYAREFETAIRLGLE